MGTKQPTPKGKNSGQTAPPKGGTNSGNKKTAR